MNYSYEIAGHRFGIRTTSDAVAHWLDETLAPYRVSEQTDPLYSVVVRDPAECTGPTSKKHVLYRDNTVLVRDLHQPTLVQSLLGELEALALHDRQDALYARVLPINLNGTTALVPALMVPVLSGGGRNIDRAGVTLPYAAAVGIDLVSGEVVPSPPLDAIPRDAAARFSELIGEPDPGRRVDVEPRSSIDVVIWVGTQQPFVEPLSRARAVSLIGDTALNLGSIGGVALQALERLVTSARCYLVGMVQAREMLAQVTMAMESD